jgi:hypothetical protein
MSKIALEYFVPNEDSSFKVALFDNSHFNSPLLNHSRVEL